MTPLYKVCDFAVMMLAHSLVFSRSREPDVQDHPSHCHSLFVFLTVRIALERRPGKLLGGPWGCTASF